MGNEKPVRGGHLVRPAAVRYSSQFPADASDVAPARTQGGPPEELGCPRPCLHLEIEDSSLGEPPEGGPHIGLPAIATRLCLRLALLRAATFLSELP
ncbi:hypothetical protein HGM15179_018120 [Zosterops borbonicus]|uniref:Uncharacterized protein n=1 Tax=Zosterops borbonicus TaxID=364589 RepID=A0A8K1FZL0_9PASS|nr:hypothetical protein HGM15179_018120 [Zosterops borbonicus]